MSVTYTDEKNLDPNIVRDFFNQYATWKVHPQVEKWEKILANSSAIVSGWDRNSLLGFARGISDEVRYAQVLDVLVHPDYRRIGIGKELIRRLVSAPAMRVRAVILGTPTMREFYEATGFQCVNDKAFFMVMVRDEYGEDLIQPQNE